MKNPISTPRVALFQRNVLLGTLTAMALLTVIPSRAQTQPSVNLRSTAGFAVLAGSLVSNVPTSAVTGHIGLSPATGGNITGFGPTEVTGTIYTVDASGPAGSVPAASMLTTAKGDLTLAYNDAANRVPVPAGTFLNPGSGNIGGMTLVPGLYKFTSSASITGSNLTLSGSATDVWIFQIAAGLNVGNGAQVILAGGARAANVFWQVGTSAVLGTTSVFKGTLLADQSISLNTGASLEGRALARIGAVTLASNAITQPGLPTATLSGARNRAHGFEIFPGVNGRDIGFVVPASGKARLTLLNTYGRELAVLFNGYAMAGQRQDIRFIPIRVSKGLYFAKLESNGQVRLGRMLLGL
jgi:hypothetical protein